jgi:uncharacterized protein
MAVLETSFHPFFRNAHLSTIAANFWKRPATERQFPLTRRVYRTEPEVQVAVDEQMPATGKPAANVMMIHGLEGASDSGYIRSLSRQMLDLGYGVHRFNMRSCGGTEPLSKTNYHAGQTSDALFVLRRIRQKWDVPLFLVGYSLGGNVSLKLAAELGSEADGLLDGVCAVSTPIDLAACAEALGKPANFIYSNRFVTRLKDRIRRRNAQYPDLYDLGPLSQVRTIQEFDDAYTAKLFGFGTAANYFATQSSNQFLERIRIPTLIIQAKDDPMIPFSVYNHPAIQGNPKIRLIATDYGGHVGFLARNQPRFWVDPIIGEFTWNLWNKRPCSIVLQG